MIEIIIVILLYFYLCIEQTRVQLKAYMMITNPKFMVHNHLMIGMTGYTIPSLDDVKNIKELEDPSWYLHMQYLLSREVNDIPTKVWFRSLNILEIIREYVYPDMIPFSILKSMHRLNGYQIHNLKLV